MNRKATFISRLGESFTAITTLLALIGCVAFAVMEPDTTSLHVRTQL